MIGRNGPKMEQFNYIRAIEHWKSQKKILFVIVINYNRFKLIYYIKKINKQNIQIYIKYIKILIS